MKILSPKLSVLSTALIAAMGLMSAPSQASAIETVANAVKEGKTSIMLRYRYETVDQDGIAEDATASTLKTRLTWQSGKAGNFSAKIEVDDVTRIGDDDYNSTANGLTQFPVVADPEGTDINQAFLKYNSGIFTGIAGRQRIVHNDQRFVGGVAWRQNEQTYDGYRLMVKPSEQWNIDYSYIFNINRIFGPSGNRADLHGQFHLLNAGYKVDKAHKLAFFAYSLDFDTAAALSSDTLGVRYTGKFSNFNVIASYATQEDAGSNPNDYTADYLNLEVGGKFDNFTAAVGYESLGSDNGVGFTTPLATLHKFQGFSDKFLGTPGVGIEDFYLKAGVKLGAWGLKAMWHNFEAETGGADLGSELDLVASYKINKHVSALLKYATYDADTHASDTDKLWFMLTAKF